MRRIALILALMLLPLVVSGQHHAGCIPTMKEHPFKGGEKINFSMTYKWGAVNTEVASGLVTLDSLVYNGQPAYHMNFKVKSAAFFDVFFKMREDFHSWFTAKDLRPLKFTRDTYEGGYTFFKGVYRPTQESMMRANNAPFNAPSRQAIYNKVMKLGLGKTPSYEEFVAFDQQHKPSVWTYQSRTRWGSGEELWHPAPPRIIWLP